MSRARAPFGFVALVAVIAVASLESCSQQDAALLDAAAPSVDTVHVNFTCGPVDSIALADKSGNAAWTISRKPNDLITWVVPNTVTIHSIGGKSPNAFPVDTTGPQGGTPGTPFKAKVKGGAANGTYHYLINATCSPGGGAPDVNLVIDPEMIVH